MMKSYNRKIPSRVFGDMLAAELLPYFEDPNLKDEFYKHIDEEDIYSVLEVLNCSKDDFPPDIHRELVCIFKDIS